MDIVGKMRQSVRVILNVPSAQGAGFTDNYGVLLTTRGWLRQSSGNRNLAFGEIESRTSWKLTLRYQQLLADNLSVSMKFIVDDVWYTVESWEKLQQDNGYYEFKINKVEPESTNNNITLGSITAGGNGGVGISAGAQSLNTGTVVFSNSNGVSFGLSGTVMTASVAPSAGVSSVVFSNANNVTFGLNGSTLTATASFNQTVQPQSSLAFSNANGVSFGINASTLTASVAAQTAAVFSNSNGLTFGTNAGTVTASYSQSSNTISAGTKSELISNVAFSNSNGVSFGLNAGTITATVKTDYQSSNANYLTSQSGQAASAANGSFAFQTLSFSNANGISFGTSAGSAITANYTVPTQTAFVFSNSNNVSFGTNGSTVTATATFNQTAQTQSNVQGIIAGTQTGRTGDMSFANSNGISFGMSGSNTVTASYTVPSTAGLLSAINVSGGATSNNLSAITFSNANGVSFGLNGSVMTASITPAGGAQTGISGISAGAAQVTSGTVSFSNANGISFGINGQTMTASHNGLTSQSNQAVSGSNGSFAFQTISFMSTHGATFYTSTDGMRLSYTVPSVAGLLSAVNISAGATSNNLSALTFSNGSGVSFGLNGSVITATVQTNYQSQGAYLTTAAQSTQTNAFSLAGNSGTTNSSVLSAGGYVIAGGSNVTLSMSNNSLSIHAAAGAGANSFNILAAGGQTAGTASTVVFSNSNGISFGMSNSSIVTASHNGITSQSNQNLSLFALGNTTQNSSTVLNASALSFNGLGAMTAGYSNGSIQLSAPATSSLSATGGVSISVNGSTISIGVPAFATLSRFEYPSDQIASLNVIPQGSLSLNRFYQPFFVTATAAKIAGSLNVSFTSATTGTLNYSLWMGIYTLNGSTLSLASSGSANNSMQVSQSASSSANSSVTGMRQLTVPMDINMTPGVYWMGAVVSSGTVGTAINQTFSMFGNTLLTGAAGALVMSPIGSNTTVGRDFVLFQGIYTAATSVGPSSIGSAAIGNSAASNPQRADFYFQVYNATY